MARIWLLCGLRGPFGELLLGIYGDESERTQHFSSQECWCVCVGGGYFPKKQKSRCWYPPSHYFLLSLLLLLFCCSLSALPSQQHEKLTSETHQKHSSLPSRTTVCNSSNENYLDVGKLSKKKIICHSLYPSHCSCLVDLIKESGVRDSLSYSLYGGKTKIPLGWQS